MAIHQPAGRDVITVVQGILALSDTIKQLNDPEFIQTFKDSIGPQLEQLQTRTDNAKQNEARALEEQQKAAAAQEAVEGARDALSKREANAKAAEARTKDALAQAQAKLKEASDKANALDRQVQQAADNEVERKRLFDESMKKFAALEQDQAALREAQNQLAKDREALSQEIARINRVKAKMGELDAALA